MRVRLLFMVLVCLTEMLAASLPGQAQTLAIAPVTEAALQDPDAETGLVGGERSTSGATIHSTRSALTTCRTYFSVSSGPASAMLGIDI